MKLEQFAMERMQSTYENQVAFNLSESGVHPLRLGELWTSRSRATRCWPKPALHAVERHDRRCASAIAAMYPGATADHIQVTNGGSEANYITTWNLVEPGDEVVMMVPNYMQTWGLARAFGATVREWPLGSTHDRPAAVAGDGRATRSNVSSSPRTKLIIICNPNNPTGARFDAADLDRIAAIAVAARQLDSLRRNLSRRGARRPRNAVDVGPSAIA